MQGQIRKNGTLCRATTWKKGIYLFFCKPGRKPAVTLQLMGVPAARVGRGGLAKCMKKQTFGLEIGIASVDHLRPAKAQFLQLPLSLKSSPQHPYEVLHARIFKTTNLSASSVNNSWKYYISRY